MQPETIESIILILLLLAVVMMSIGMVRPSFVVFWSKNKSRSQVLMVWGLMLVIMGIAFFTYSSQRGTNHGFSSEQHNESNGNIAP